MDNNNSNSNNNFEDSITSSVRMTLDDELEKGTQCSINGIFFGFCAAVAFLTLLNWGQLLNLL